MNNDQLVLSIDIGTSSVKCGFFDQKGRIVSVSRVSSASSELEDAASRWEEALLSALQDCSDLLDSVAAVCVCGNGPTVIPVDETGNHCSATVVWNDPEISRIPGGTSLFLPAVKLAMERMEPMHSAVRWFCGTPEFITGRMTGNWYTFLPSREFIPFIWEKQEADMYQVPFHLLPPMCPLGERAGHIQLEWASVSKLPAGIPVFAGGPDYLMALLGTAVVEPGRVCDRAGSSEALNLCIAADTYREAKSQVHSEKIRVLPHCIPNRYTAAVMLPHSGLLYSRFLETAGADDVSEASLGERIFALSWLDDSFLPAVMETYYGLSSGGSLEASIGSVMNHLQQKDWALAGRIISEALGWIAVHGMMQLRSLGYPVTSLRISGGQSFSEGWNQLKADMLNLPVEVPILPDGELLGCASVSFSSMGLFDSFSQASETLYAPDRIISPGSERSKLFAGRMATLFPQQFRQIQP